MNLIDDVAVVRDGVLLERWIAAPRGGNTWGSGQLHDGDRQGQLLSVEHRLLEERRSVLIAAEAHRQHLVRVGTQHQGPVQAVAVHGMGLVVLAPVDIGEAGAVGPQLLRGMQHAGEDHHLLVHRHGRRDESGNAERRPEHLQQLPRRGNVVAARPEPPRTVEEALVLFVVGVVTQDARPRDALGQLLEVPGGDPRQRIA